MGSTFNTELWGSILFGGAAPGVAGPTVQDLLYNAYRTAGIPQVVSRPGRGLSQEELADGMFVLNATLDSWNTERLAVPALVRAAFDLIVGKQTLTIGPTDADLTVAIRPPKIEAASILDITSNPAQPLDIPLKPLRPEQWQHVAVKNVPSTYPASFYYEPFFPSGILNLYPIPQVPNKLILQIWQLAGNYQTSADVISLPPGYWNALVWNIAVDLCPRWNKPLDPTTAARAKEYKAAIKRLNVPDVVLRCDGALTPSGGRYSWIADTFGNNR